MFLQTGCNYVVPLPVVSFLSLLMLLFSREGRKKVLEDEQPGHDMLMTHTEPGSNFEHLIPGNEGKITDDVVNPFHLTV